MNLCTPADVYEHGLARGSLPSTGRVVSVSVDGGEDGSLLRLRQHGFALDTPLRFRAEEGGALPSPLERDVTYYTIPAHDDAFRVALTASVDGVPADALELSSAGCGVIVIPPDPVLSACAFASRLILQMLPAHVLPLAEPVPEILKITAAQVAAWKALAQAGGSSTSLTALLNEAKPLIATWAKGVPLRENPPPAAGKAVTAAAPRSRSACDWERYGGIK